MKETDMRSKLALIDSLTTGDALDQLFLDCAELEGLVASILQAIDGLSPAVDSGLVTAEHLMNLTYRIEAAERGLITVAHQIGDTVDSVVQRDRKAAPVH